MRTGHHASVTPCRRSPPSHWYPSLWEVCILLRVGTRHRVTRGRITTLHRSTRVPRTPPACEVAWQICQYVHTVPLRHRPRGLLDHPRRGCGFRGRALELRTSASTVARSGLGGPRRASFHTCAALRGRTLPEPAGPITNWQYRMAGLGRATSLRGGRLPRRRVMTQRAVKGRGKYPSN